MVLTLVTPLSRERIYLLPVMNLYVFYIRKVFNLLKYIGKGRELMFHLSDEYSYDTFRFFLFPLIQTFLKKICRNFLCKK